MRHEFGFCSGPCAGFVSEWEYRRKVETAAAFLEGRTIQPVDRVIAAMQEAATEARFEVAARWREKFEQLEWLLAATSRARTRGATSVAYSSMPRRIRSWARVPALYFRSNRDSPSVSVVAAIFSATVSGEPT